MKNILKNSLLLFFTILILVFQLLACTELDIKRGDDMVKNPETRDNPTQEKTKNPDEIQNSTYEDTSETNDKSSSEQDSALDFIKTQIESMTLEEKIGQMLMVGFEGLELDEQIIKMIEEDYLGGVILFKRNINDAPQLLNLINDLKTTNMKNKIPIFVGVDEEGGSISRMPDAFRKIPTNRNIGKQNDEEFAFKIGSTIGNEIKSLGFNVDFAPVLDIDSNPNNPVIGDRSLGSDEKIVSDLGIQIMKGIQSQDIISVVKHFPGHGDTLVDSHVGLPTVDKNIDDLMEFELIPFKEAIKHNVDGIMVAHILYSNLDPQNPASLSEKIIDGLLREQMNYDGLVITDDMTMGAILENYDIGDAAVQSIKAGSDILLVCHGYDNEIKALDSLRASVRDGVISEERIDESVYRILTLKEKYQISDEIIEDIDVEQINNTIDQILVEKGLN